MNISQWISISRQTQVRKVDVLVAHANVDTNTMTGSLAVVNRDIVGQFPGTYPLSEAHCAAINNWLAECVGNNAGHQRCNQTISGHKMNLNAWDAPLPSRCVEVLGERKVCLSQTDNQKGAYITLSHRWEDDTGKCSTTTENYNAHRAEVPFSDLTKTFQDAILVAHRIGIRYLWIDSICIIQEGDGGLDWKKESEKMAQYYQHSIFTLAAVRGRGQAGLFSNESQLGDRTLIRLPYRDRSGNKRGYMYLYLIDHDLSTSYGKEIRGNELFGRGWVYQEQMLSRRLLYYTEAGVIFECRTGNPESTLGDQWTKNDVQGGDFEAVFRWIRRTENERKRSNPLISVLLKGKFDLVQRSFDTWYKLAEEYSSKNLSFWSDRITALSGIAAEYRLFMQLWGIPPYLSGIWTGDACCGLLWKQQTVAQSIWQTKLERDEGVPKKSERARGIPSWSWASIPALISWDHLYPHRKRLIEACSVTEAAEINEERSETWKLSSKKEKPSISSRSTTGTLNSLKFPIDRVINQLKISGKIQHVILREGRPSDVNSNTLLPSDHPDKETPNPPFIFHHRWKNFGHESLRQFVYSPLQPDLVAGWASFDGPGYGPIEDAGEEDGLPRVYALWVVTEKRAEPFGLSLGYWLPWNDFYHVLFLRKLGDHLYQRAGVGVLFGKDIDRGFLVEDEEFMLV